MSGNSGIEWTSIDAPRSIPPRWRWIGWLIVLAIVGALVTFAIIEGDKIVRDVASGVVRTGITTALDLPEGTDMDVDLGDGILVFQAVTGSIDSVDVSIPGVAVGGATGTLHLVVTGVKLDPSKPVDTLTANVEIDEANMLLLGGNLSSVPISAVTMGDDSLVTIAADLAGTPATVSLAPTVLNGAVVFTPSTLTAAGAPITYEALVASPLAPLAAPLLTTQALCVAEYLPKALTVTAVAVADKHLVITATGKDVGLTALGSKGTCAVPAA